MRLLEKQVRLVSQILLVLVLLFCSACTAGNSAATALTGFQGEVLVKKAGAADWARAAADMKLEKGDIIKAGTSAGAVVTFFDGSTIELKADTQIEIAELVQEKSTAIRLKQQIGETISTVKKLADPASRYEIETPSAVAAVRGSAMQVSVTQDGTTRVQNLEGKISVLAQGVEVAIPVGSSSTVLPGQPPASPQPVLTTPASTQLTGPPSSDAANDLFDSQGKPVSGEGYQDIRGITLVREGDIYVLTIGLNGDIPSSVDSSIFMEWDLMVDTDLNAKTGWSTPLFFNDIGADYYLNFYISGDRTSAGGFITADTAGSRFTDVTYKVSGSIVEIRFPSKDISGVSSFNYLVLSRKYDNSSKPSLLLGADKFPDTGHMVFK